MALGSDTFSSAGGAVSDLFKGFGDIANSNLKATGLNIDAQGQRVTAQGTRLNAAGLRIKAQGDLAEASNYVLASELAGRNQQFTAASTAIKQAQLDRSITSTIGGQQAQVAGAGFAASGSALDLLRDSASQGQIARSVAGDQGLITGASYVEQQTSYQTLAQAGVMAATGENAIADKTDLIANQQDVIANRTDQLANDTRSAGKTAATGDFISSFVKGGAAIFSLLL
jgi:hypothetical protein